MTDNVVKVTIELTPRPFRVGDRVQWKDPHDTDTATVLAVHDGYLWVVVDDGEPCSEEARWMMHATETER